MGEVFAGRYELIDQIGEGGMGSVWRVRDLRRERVVAAKVLRQSDAGSLLRFMREQGMRIHHPSVVTPLGWAGEDDRVLFTMPVVEGGSVADLMKRHGALPPRYVAELMRQMLAALGAVHDSGVVHRDVKPANLLLDATGSERPHLWLTDFGVAVATDVPRLTSMSVVMGTPGYLAPEQLRGDDPDRRSDLYAAGMVGFQMLTGHRPRAQMRSEAQDLPPRPAGTPDVLWQVLTALADPHIERRPRDAHDARARLGADELQWQPQTQVVVPSMMPPLAGVGEGEFIRPGGRVDPTFADGGATRAGSPTQAGGPTRASGHAAPDDQTVPSDGSTHPSQIPRTAAMGSVPSRADAATVAGPAASSAPTADRSGARTQRRRSPLAVLVVAPLAALLIVGTMIWAPWQSGGTGPRGGAVVGGTCAWHDVGTFEPDQHGDRLACAYRDGHYRWVAPQG